MFENFLEYTGSIREQIKGTNPYILVLPAFVFSVVAGLVTRTMIVYFLTAYVRKTNNTFAWSLKNHLGARTRLFFPLLIFYLLQPFIRLPDEHFDLILFKTAQTLVLLVFGWLLLQLISVFEDVAAEYYEADLKDPFKARKIKTQLHFIRRIMSIVIVVLVLSAILLTFDSVREVGATLLTSAGVAGIIVGIAAQKSLANLLAGMQIAIT